VSRPDESALVRAMPVVFVLIWSTGFVVARLGMPHAPPLTFLAWRFALSIVAIGGGLIAWMLIQAAHKAMKPEDLSLPKTREQVSRDLKSLSERVH